MSTKINLLDGNSIPIIGFGTYRLSKEETENVVLEALQYGYRHLDCASFYNNEDAVGRAIKRSGLDRRELFITSKVWNDCQGFDATLASAEKSLQDLQVDYFDLYLVHWPVPGLHLETYRAIQELQRLGKTRSIGISNYTIDDFEELLAHFSSSLSFSMPVLNQIEVNPFLYRQETIEYFRARNIQIAAYRPLRAGENSVIQNPIIQEISMKLNRTPGQVLIRWGLQQGFIVLPKSGNPERIQENINVFDFEISENDMQLLNTLTTDDSRSRWLEHYMTRRTWDAPTTN